MPFRFLPFFLCIALLAGGCAPSSNSPGGPNAFTVLTRFIPGGKLLRKDDGNPGPLYAMSVREMFKDNPQAQALARAAARGDTKTMDRLVQQGADVNATGAYGVTVPAWLIFHYNEKGLLHLLHLGADPNIIWEDDDSLIHLATFYASTIGTDFLEILLKEGGANPDLEVGWSHKRPLDWTGSYDVTAFVPLYNSGADIEFRDWRGDPYIFQVNDRYDYVLFLLHEGVDYTPEFRNGRNFINVLEDGPMPIWGNKLLTPDKPQFMWFWRCVDFLEKRGTTFNFEPEVEQLRPQVLDTSVAPEDVIFTKSPRAIRWKRAAYQFDVKLQYPTPYWTHTEASKADYEVFHRRSETFFAYDFVPKNESVENPSKKLSVEFTQSPEENFADQRGAFLQSLLESWLVTKVHEGAQGSGLYELYHLQSVEPSARQGVLYVGKYKETFVTVLQQSDTADESIMQRIEKDMNKIIMSEGFKFLTYAERFSEEQESVNESQE